MSNFAQDWRCVTHETSSLNAINCDWFAWCGSRLWLHYYWWMHQMTNLRFPHAWNAHKVCHTLTQCKRGMYVGGNSASNVFACVSVQLRKQPSNFITLWQKACYGFVRGSKEDMWCNKLEGLKTFVRFHCIFCLMKQMVCWGYTVFLSVEHDWLTWSRDK